MKGYMIFVEGGNAPQVVHESYGDAMKQVQHLACKLRGKEIFLLQIQKRVIKAVKTEEETPLEEETPPEKLPTHIPPKVEGAEKRRLGLNDLVFRQQV